MTKKSKFTLIELLVAMAIIAILAGLIMAATGMATKKAKNKKTVATIKKLECGLDKYKDCYGTYPIQGTAGVFNPTKFKNKQGVPFLEGYASGVMEDAWGNPLIYKYPGDHNTGKYDLWSKGNDEESDPNNSNTLKDDITNW